MNQIYTLALSVLVVASTASFGVAKAQIPTEEDTKLSLMIAIEHFYLRLKFLWSQYDAYHVLV